VRMKFLQSKRFYRRDHTKQISLVSLFQNRKASSFQNYDNKRIGKRSREIDNH